MEYTPNLSQQGRHQVLQNITADKIDSIFEKNTGEEIAEQDVRNIVKLADAYQFSDSELNFVKRKVL